MDVVQALRSDWSTDPFQFVEKDGYFYGRGTQDMKDSDAALVETFLRLHREGYKPQRDLILALTADEEGGKFNGADWLVREHRDLVDAAYVINPDAGGIELENGRPLVAEVEATEKLYADYQITATNRGGHSSLPRPDNAIYELAACAWPPGRLHVSLRVERCHANLLYKPRCSGDGADGSRYARDSGHASGHGCGRALERGACFQRQAAYHLRRHSAHAGGHANNALPQTAQAIVNCRILPGHSPEEIRKQLISIFADPQLKVEYVSNQGDVSATAPERKAIVPPAPIEEVWAPLTSPTQAIWPGITVTPVMETGASDSIYFAQAGIPSYGYSAIALERDDVRAHGRDERLPIDSYWKSLDFWYAFAKALSGK